MMEKKDKRPISRREDIDHFVAELYRKLMQDPEIGHFFTHVVKIDLKTHIPKIADFWESVLFQTGNYQGDPMSVHIQLHRASPISANDFEVWLKHFAATIDADFEGELAERAKQRAISIAMIMQIKITNASKI